MLVAGALAGLNFPVAAQVEIKLAKEPEADIRRDATVNSVEKVMPSVVNIATSRLVEYRDDYDDAMRRFFGQPRRQPETKEQLYSLGSGVIIDDNGYILTNWHVVRGGTRVQVQLSDGSVYEADKIVATTKSDVALLKLRAKPGEKFSAIKFAKDDDLLLGETVIALGNPFGLSGSVTRGILSSKNRRSASGEQRLDKADWLQTDAAINPGNSGGPLVNLRGELIGINVATMDRAPDPDAGFSQARPVQGIGFAIPIREVAAALSEFFSPEVLPGVWFGAKIKAGVTPLTVAEVQPGSPAARAGLKTGMQIAEVNGKVPHSLVDFLEQVVGRTNIDQNIAPTNFEQVVGVPAFNPIAGLPESRDVALVAFDAGIRRSLTVKMEPFRDVVMRRTGLVLDKIQPQDSVKLGLRDGQGLLITSVEKGSPADAAELKAGMLVTGIDATVATDLRDFGSVLIQKGAGEKVALNIVALQRVNNSLVQPVQGRVELKLRNE